MTQDQQQQRREQIDQIQASQQNTNQNDKLSQNYFTVNKGNNFQNSQFGFENMRKPDGSKAQINKIQQPNQINSQSQSYGQQYQQQKQQQQQQQQPLQSINLNQQQAQPQKDIQKPFINISQQQVEQILATDKNAKKMLEDLEEAKKKMQKGYQPQQQKKTGQAEFMNEFELENKRREILQKLREDEVKVDKTAQFDHIILKERLKYNTPLQKLYEKVYFDDFNLEIALRPFDNFHDFTVSMKDFQVIIIKEVQGIDPSQELDLLCQIDLARLKIPFNLLYQRHKYDIEKLPQPDLTQKEVKHQHETYAMFAYKDPRLRHLNKNFKREELQIHNIDFVLDKTEFQAAIDDIIKFNCHTNEFNYMHEVFTNLNDLLVKKTVSYDWGKLFDCYNKDGKNLLEKIELKEMLIDCGFVEVTDAERDFVFNVISFFQKQITKTIFKDWINSMIGRPQKKLIFYSQYLDTKTMRITKTEDVIQKQESELNFHKALRGIEESAIEKKQPLVVKFIANEISLLGEEFFQHTVEKNAVLDENDRALIEFDQLVLVIQKFQYICNSEDRGELRIWLYNNGLFAQTPKYFDPQTIYIDIKNLIQCLRDLVSLVTQKRNSQTMDKTLPSIYNSLRQSILDNEINKAIEALKVFKIDEEIGERELRKILNQCLSGITVAQQHGLVESLRHFKPADEFYMFRRFELKEVIETLEKIRNFKDTDSRMLTQKSSDIKGSFKKDDKTLTRQGYTDQFIDKDGNVDIDGYLLTNQTDEFVDQNDQNNLRGQSSINFRQTTTDNFLPQQTTDFMFTTKSLKPEDFQPDSQKYREQKAEQLLRTQQNQLEQKEQQKHYISHPQIRGNVYSSKDFSTSKSLLATPSIYKNQANYTEILNQTFDKMFEFVKTKVEADQYGYFEQKLRSMIDYVSQAFEHVDFKITGYFYGWELKDYMTNEPNGLFQSLNITSDEMDAFLRFSTQIAGIDTHEKDNILSVKIRHSFLLAQLEQNFYMRFDHKY
eukprot:403336739